jgi:hypothetical protein
LNFEVHTGDYQLQANGGCMKKLMPIFCSMLSLSSYSAELERNAAQQLSQEQIRIIAETYTFFELLTMAVQIDYFPLSESEIFRMSDVAVTGYIESVTEGRAIYNSHQVYPSPIRTSIIKLKVNSVLKGTVSDYVYIEYITAGMAPEILDAAKYDGEILVYLAAQVGRYAEANFDVENSEKGVMNEVDQLYDLVTTAALIIFEEDETSKEIIKKRPLLGPHGL